jgi:hypothetical protein
MHVYFDVQDRYYLFIEAVYSVKRQGSERGRGRGAERGEKYAG